MATGLGEFFLKIVVQSAEGELSIQGLVKQMGELEVASVGELAILGDLADRLIAVSKASIAASNQLLNYSAATGASTDKLQEWQAAAAHVGISADTVASGLEAVSQGIEGMKRYGEHSPLANLLQPLNMTDFQKYEAMKPEQLLDAIRNSPIFQKMDAANQKFVLAKAGLDGLLRVLTKGPTGVSDAKFAKFVEEAGKLSEDQISKLNRMGSEFTSIELLTRRIGRNISGWFLGPLMATLTRIVSALDATTRLMETIQNGKLPSFNEVKAFGSDVLSPAIGLVNPASPLEHFGESIVHGILNSGFFTPRTSAAFESPLQKNVTVSQVNHISIKGSGLTPQQLKTTTVDALNDYLNPAIAMMNGGIKH